jgi:pyruvate carboxylase subunit B
VIDKDQPVITDRPADHIKPELEKAKIEIGDLAKSEEDVISYALFPQVARDFFSWREAGSKPEPELVAAVASVLTAEQQRNQPHSAPPSPERSPWKVAGRQRLVRVR